MEITNARSLAREKAISRVTRKITRPSRADGNLMRMSEYYGENIFDFKTASGIPDKAKKELLEIVKTKKPLTRALADAVAIAVTEWALNKGATHFCHWFQPLTGSTAEKHDAFLNLKDESPIESFSGSQLMQGEPDASSFPNGGSRSTFEARGYTSWDMSSPLFIAEGENGKTLCIPTAFVSYHGEALDMKTPLLRSINTLSATATKFLNLIGEENVKSVVATCGAEQEYFLVDKAFYYARPDLVMTGRTLFGCPTSKNQQLDDHYFGSIPERVKGFMDELNLELHKLGIPAKTQHNEVAPGQFELAPIFEDANIASDHNQLIMATISNVARRHDFVALLHEKPFAGINGSGKHVNWSMASDTGINLLEPGENPHNNQRFLTVVAGIIEAVKRHGDALRMSIAGHGNDHRLGANEAPPSIISIFLGDTLDKIYQSILDGKDYSATVETGLDLGAAQLASLFKDNTDRNRTSPFAFTGNKFEFRAVGSSQTISFPTTILNAAVCEVFNEANKKIEADLKAGKKIEEILFELTKGWIKNSYHVVFNGDGYSDEWVEEAQKRGLPNLRTSADALALFTDESKTAFLLENGIFKKSELEMRYNAFLEKYITCREIEFNCLNELVLQQVIPAAVNYKQILANVIKTQKEIGLESRVEVELYKQINFALESLYATHDNLKTALNALPDNHAKASKIIADELMPLSVTVGEHCQTIEGLVSEELWRLPKYYDLLFIR